MATSPLSGSSLPFNIPSAFDAVKAIDAEFWPLHAHWRPLEDEFNASAYGSDDPEGEALLNQATAARDAMFLCEVWTAAALLVKFEACEEGDCMSSTIRPGISVFDAIKWDCERVMQRELGL